MDDGAIQLEPFDVQLYHISRDPSIWPKGEVERIIRRDPFNRISSMFRSNTMSRASSNDL